jgi:hypothetical protein
MGCDLYSYMLSFFTNADRAHVLTPCLVVGLSLRAKEVEGKDQLVRASR